MWGNNLNFLVALSCHWGRADSYLFVAARFRQKFSSLLDPTHNTGKGGESRVPLVLCHITMFHLIGYDGSDALLSTVPY
jgi:hypothetical protein